MEEKYLIFSCLESFENKEPLFWSNKYGWATIESADTFDMMETERFMLVLSGGPVWVTQTRANWICELFAAKKKLDTMLDDGK
jgi:hypothetical protein